MLSHWAFKNNFATILLEIVFLTDIYLYACMSSIYLSSFLGNSVGKLWESHVVGEQVWRYLKNLIMIGIADGWGVLV